MRLQHFSLKVMALLCTLSFGAMAAETVTKPIRQLGYGKLTATALSPDGTQFLTGSTDGQVRLWDVGVERWYKHLQVYLMKSLLLPFPLMVSGFWQLLFRQPVTGI